MISRAWHAAAAAAAAAVVAAAGKVLRDWIVAQLVWADEGRLAMMRNADYLNAATSEVESVAACYENVFKAVERLAHFCLNVLLMVIYVDVPARTPVAALCVLSQVCGTTGNAHVLCYWQQTGYLTGTAHVMLPAREQLYHWQQT